VLIYKIKQNFHHQPIVVKNSFLRILSQILVYASTSERKRYYY
jgi:hypothetical protein